MTSRARSALRRAKEPQRVLDWEPNHDPASRLFPAAALVAGPPVHDVLWRPGRVLDQGAEGSCVGHAAVGSLGAQPVQATISHSLAVQWYHHAQGLDEWPGDRYVGTSVNAGMKVGKRFGWWDEYRWAFGVDDMRDAIQLGPLVLGVPWHVGMYSTPADGIVRVTGQQVGGHCLAVVGWATDYAGAGPGFWWLNSWGPGYGVGGVAYVPEDTMRELVAKVGECAVPIAPKRGRSLDV